MVRVGRGLVRQALEALHDLGMSRPAAGGVEHQLVNDLGVVDGQIGPDPAAQRLAGYQRAGPAQALEDGQHVIGVVLDLVIDGRLVGPAVPEHVDGHEPEVLAVRAEVSRIGLGVAADPVQGQHQRLGRVARGDEARTHSIDVEEALREADPAKVRPHAREISRTLVAHQEGSVIKPVFVGSIARGAGSPTALARTWSSAADN